MTSFKNSLIVNHEVYHSQVSPDSGYYMATSSGIEDASKYYSREGEYSYKGEIDKSFTTQDIYLERIKALEEIDEYIDYVSREGKYKDRNPEIPMRKGEVSGALWDAHGVVDRKSFRSELLDSGSNYIRSVVSIPREWAAELNMITKEDWQKFIRDNWNDYVSALNIPIPEQHQRWVSWFHTDNEVNLHVHIITWDASGKHFYGEKDIPHKFIHTSKEVLRKALYKDISLTRSNEKNFYREACVQQINIDRGLEISQQEMIRLEGLALKAGISFQGLRKCVSEDKLKSLDPLLKSITESLPSSGIGRIGYMSLSPDGKAAVHLYIEQLKIISPAINTYMSAMEDSFLKGADILGKENRLKSEYLQKEKQDLISRISRNIIKDAAEQNLPWKTDKDLSKERSLLLKHLEDNIPHENELNLANQFIKNSNISDKSLYWNTSRVFDIHSVKEKIEHYERKVLQYVKTEYPKLTDYQAERIGARIKNDLLGEVKQLNKDKALSLSLSKMQIHDSLFINRVISYSRNPSEYNSKLGISLFGVAGYKDFNHTLDTIKESVSNRRTNNNNLNQSLRVVADKLLILPEINSSIENSVIAKISLNSPIRDLMVLKSQVIKDRREMIISALSDQINKEIEFEDNRKSRGLVIENLLTNIIRKHSVDDYVLNPQLIKIKKQPMNNLDPRLERSL